MVSKKQTKESEMLKLLNGDDSTIIDIESRYPEMTDLLIMHFYNSYKLFCKKQSDYGDGNIRLGRDIDSSNQTSSSVKDNVLAQFGVAIRMSDKINRLMTLIEKELMNNGDPNNESIEDSCLDIMNYANMLMIIRKNKWGK
tara:strand:+ start:3172 stop:3594 length:423 start_codon:yes stop_codon:yes gene_type:complete